MFFVYLNLLALFVFGSAIWHIVRTPYDKLIDQNYSDRLIKEVKRNFPIRKWVNKN